MAGPKRTYIFSFVGGVKSIDEQRKFRDKATKQLKKHRDKVGRAYYVAARLRKYGLTEEQFLNMLREQRFTCATCPSVVSPDDKVNTHIDHCHATGVVRGVLCRACNLALGYARDDPELMDRLAAYLRADRN